MVGIEDWYQDVTYTYSNRDVVEHSLYKVLFPLYVYFFISYIPLVLLVLKKVVGGGLR